MSQNGPAPLLILTLLASLTVSTPACKMPAATPSWDTSSSLAAIAADRTPAQVVAAMGSGWNLGNTLEGIPTEGDWGNAPVAAATFDDIEAAGFQSVRVPVYFGGEHMGESPSYTIATGWLTRVSTVVDQALARDLTVIVDMHHYWKLCAGFANAPDATIEKIATLWTQVAVCLRAKSDRVLFEVMNEPGDQWGDQVNNLTVAQNNQLNARVVAAIRATGGRNASRCILVPLRYTDSYQTTGFVLPSDPNLILTFHWYTPWNFVAGTNQTWGTASELAELADRFKAVHDFAAGLGVPVILGEFGLGRSSDRSTGLNPRAQQWHWQDSVARTAWQYGFCPMVWDNGEWLDRTNHLWRDPVQPNLLIQAGLGVANSWATGGSTLAEDTLAVGTEAVSVPLTLNGNTLTGVSGGGVTWVAGANYSVVAATLVLGAAGVSALPSGTTTLWLTFDAGADSFIVLRK